MTNIPFVGGPQDGAFFNMDQKPESVETAPCGCRIETYPPHEQDGVITTTSAVRPVCEEHKKKYRYKGGNNDRTS